MPPAIQVGTILMKDWPGTTQLLNLESEPCSGNWNMLKTLDSFSLDRKIHAAGWNFFFIAAEVKVMFFGAVGAAKIDSALQGLLRKVRAQSFNTLEITGIDARHFLGVPYVTVSAHSRHMQESCQLDSTEARQASEHNAELPQLEHRTGPDLNQPNNPLAGRFNDDKDRPAEGKKL